MIPVPQYPLYSATISEYGAFPIEYYLDEDHNWALNIDELERSINAVKDRCVPRGIVIINPGNPTGRLFAHDIRLTSFVIHLFTALLGQVLSYENIKNVIRFAQKHKLFIMADEVYQDNVYLEKSKFFSFKKAMMELGAPFDKMPMGRKIVCKRDSFAISCCFFDSI